MRTRIPLPAGMAYGWWQFDSDFLEDLSFEVDLLSGEEETPGRYFQLYQGRIGGVGFYFGFQTNVFHPCMGWQGKGLIFTRWESRSDGDACPAEGGWVENAGHEGDFVGVRLRFAWRLARYRCRLLPTAEEQCAQWYEFRLLSLDSGERITAGSLRFPKRSEQGRALIHSGGVSWTEVYGHGRLSPEDVPRTHMVLRSVAANSGSVRPIRCRTDYNSAFQNSDCYVSESGDLHLISGQHVSRTHPPQSYEFGY